MRDPGPWLLLLCLVGYKGIEHVGLGHDRRRLEDGVGDGERDLKTGVELG